MSNIPNNQNNNGQSNQQNGHQYNNVQRYMNPQQVYMQYQQHLNSYGMSPHVQHGYPVHMDPSQYQYMPKMNPNIAHPLPQVQSSPFHQQSQYNINSNSLQHHLYLSPRTKNYMHYENAPYKIQYRTQSEPLAPIHSYSTNIKKQEINGDREININPMIVGYDCRNNVYRQGMTDRNIDLQRYQYDQQNTSQGTNIPFDMLCNIERGVSSEIAKLRDCISEDCRLVFGEIKKLETPFPLYDVNGSKVYSIREILSHLLPYHLYNFDLSKSHIDIPEVKPEILQSESKFEVTSSIQINELRNKLDILSNDKDLSTDWKCYKAIMKSISNHNARLNESTQPGIVGANDNVDTNANMQQPMSYSQCMNYMQYTGGGTCQPHNPSNNNNYWE